MKRQLLIFLAIFLILTVGIHFQAWVSHPLDHLLSLPESGAYGLGMLHPLIFTLLVYLVVAAIAWVGRILKRVVSK